MSKTKGDCLALFLRYIDEATKKGVALPVNKNADYRDKFNYLLSDSQVYIATLIKIPAVFQVTQNPIPNQLGLLQGFEIKQYLPETSKIYTQTGTKSYYFEIDNIGTVTIAVNGVTVKTIDNTAKRQFTSYRGNTGANATDTVTITFSGDYPYNIRNIAMYAYAFSTDDDVPDYTPYVSYSMPDDFMSFDSVIIKTDPRVYETYLAQKWENNKKVIFEYYKQGSFDIHYFKYPAVIAPAADDSTSLEIEDKAIEVLALDIAVKATAVDRPDISSWLRSIFIEKIQNLTIDKFPGETTVQTVFSMM